MVEVGAGHVGIVEIFAVDGAQLERGDAGGLHCGAHRGRDEGVVALDDDAAGAELLERLGVALAGEVAIVELQRSLDGVGELVTAIPEEGIGVALAGDGLPGRQTVAVGERAAIGEHAQG